MKEKLSLLAVALMSAAVSLASPVDFNKAAKKATSLLGKSIVATENLTSETRARIGNAESSINANDNIDAYPAFYVFNAADGEGFVIVSGEDEMPELVAYSPTGRFASTNMHPALKGMLDTYTTMVEAVRNGDATFSLPAQTPRAEAEAVKPLCATEWGQGEPYNTLCPQDNGTTCPVGCVATALAQIMYHFAWPSVGTGSFSYASGLSGVGVIGSKFEEHQYDWGAMKTSTKELLESEEASKQVAQLSYDCGIATRMTYTADASGTNDDLAMTALYTYFAYKASPLRIEHRSCYATQEEWNELVKTELDNNRPVLYGGYTQQMAGHEFIIDGYDKNDFFHVNWGWDGSCNGYYSIVTLDPQKTNLSFSKDQSMVCGIEPDITGEDKTPRQWRLYMYEPPTVDAESVEVGKSFNFNIGLFYNRSRTAHTWMHAAALYDLNGNQLGLLSKKTSSNKSQYLSYYGPSSSPVVKATMPEDTPDGYYAIRSVFRQDEYTEFVLPDMEGGSALNSIYVKVDNGTVLFNVDLPDAISAPFEGEQTVVSTEYYDLGGRRLSSPSRVNRGTMVIVRQRLGNGKTMARKVTEDDY